MSCLYRVKTMIPYIFFTRVTSIHLINVLEEKYIHFMLCSCKVNRFVKIVINWSLLEIRAFEDF